MALSTFSGPLRVGQGDAAGTVLATRVLPITVQNTANTDLVLTMPRGRVTTLIVFTDTAFGASTDATIQIGTVVGGAQHVAATTIKGLGKVVLTLSAGGAANLGNFPILPEGTPLYVRIVQTGTPSATGSATLVAEYIPVVA